ncbi:MAG TPA: hypothetical protein PLP99_10980 [Ignavibacteriales bacterium]|nr:hypothetical protein [Ignavibacteriales bacterium]HOL82263.1 hypothetical protein [Ignavibacteriales bacterium]HPP34483.1 hypothetical protein [Ignavibacteriales bacterium]HRT98713.1 hypothetical protein [Ignavibacteriales bacterium]
MNIKKEQIPNKENKNKVVLLHLNQKDEVLVYNTIFKVVTTIEKNNEKRKKYNGIMKSNFNIL